MRLLKYKVTNFRSVKDSGWIEAGDIMALVGINESGKTNLLLPLWKLNPSQEGQGEIEYLNDFPKESFAKIRDEKGKHSFITAVFKLTKEERGKLGSLSLSNSTPPPSFEAREEENDDGTPSLENTKLAEAEIAKKKDWGEQIQVARFYDGHYEIIDIDNEGFSFIFDPSKDDLPLAASEFLKILPHFIYYSNYGNLDATINLADAVKQLKNLPDLDPASNKAAKLRTLRTLFKFVRLDPEEIASLGHVEPDVCTITKTQQVYVHNNQIAGTPQITETVKKSPEDAETKDRLDRERRERRELLSSAATNLTEEFKNWWGQGNYTFKFDVDGDSFRVRVSDDKRRWDVELENRSTGLQWFFSFFLTFLTARDEEHKNTILLLDEPGLTLHPLAQTDLTKFFKNLAEENQLFYTSHSPFLIDADRLDRVIKVYSAKDGHTVATSDLRKGASQEDRGASYAVHSAIGLTVSDSLLLGCQAVLVEGPSDQHYLSAIKNFLIKEGKIHPSKELVFLPCGGCKTIRPVASLLLGRDEKLPYVILDGDKKGKETKTALKNEYQGADEDRLISLDTLVPEIENPEIEDLFPYALLIKEFSKVVRDQGEREFEDCYIPEKSFVPQVQEWAEQERITLPDDWKVSLAKKIKERLSKQSVSDIGDKLGFWEKLFEKFCHETKS